MKAERLPSGAWRVRVYISNGPKGKSIRKSFTSPDKKKVLAQAAAFADTHRNVQNLNSFETAMDNFIRDRAAALSPSTLRGYSHIQKKFKNKYPGFCALSIFSISSADIQQIISKMLTQEKLSAKTIKNRLGLISAVLAYNNIAMPPVKAPQVAKPTLNIPDSSIVKQVIKAAESNPELWICIMLAATGPLRRGEIAALGRTDQDGDPLENIDFVQNMIHVHHSMVKGIDGKYYIKPPKTKNSDRYIPMDPRLLQVIKNQGYVTDWKPIQIHDKFMWLLKQNKLPHFRFHDLRHYCISELLANGIEEIYIAERSGHADHASLNIYSHVLHNHHQDVNQKVLAKFDQLYKLATKLDTNLK